MLRQRLLRAMHHLLSFHPGRGEDDARAAWFVAFERYAHLLACGKDPAYDRVEGADHGFRFAGTPPRDGWADLHGRIVDWFLKP